MCREPQSYDSARSTIERFSYQATRNTPYLVRGYIESYTLSITLYSLFPCISIPAVYSQLAPRCSRRSSRFSLTVNH